MNGNTIKNIILIVMSAVGGFIAEHLGGVDKMLIALLIFMLIDYITGLAVAFLFHKSTKTKNGRASSQEGFKGIARKMCIIALIVLAHELDCLMKIDYTRSLVILFFLGNEGLSILENMGLMGVPYPEFIKKALEVMKDKSTECGVRNAEFTIPQSEKPTAPFAQGSLENKTGKDRLPVGEGVDLDALRGAKKNE